MSKPSEPRCLRPSRVVGHLGRRQCGKTTLAREFVRADSMNYFDLESPASLARLSEPETALRPLQGLVVIDEIQRRPALFPLLRVLADRQPLPERFLILGSASPALLRQSSETLAGRTGGPAGDCPAGRFPAERRRNFRAGAALAAGRIPAILHGPA
ncbi:MAG: AAA family ATPase [Kiritimatiellaeota bacterium]|nr:AAA family ATPase [Kiritimatiellota bacterium]